MSGECGKLFKLASQLTSTNIDSITLRPMSKSLRSDLNVRQAPMSLVLDKGIAHTKY
jgi:hypothetical protein